jgi:hypothetical protein
VEVRAELARDDLGEARLSKTGEPRKEDVIGRLAALPRRLERDLELLARHRLTHELVEGPGSQPFRIVVAIVRGVASNRGRHGGWTLAIATATASRR